VDSHDNLPDPVAAAAIARGRFAADRQIARARIAQPVIEFRVPFAVSRQAVADVEHGPQDPDWQPVKDAALTIAKAEDRGPSYIRRLRRGQHCRDTQVGVEPGAQPARRHQGLAGCRQLGLVTRPAAAATPPIPRSCMPSLPSDSTSISSSSKKTA